MVSLWGSNLYWEQSRALGRFFEPSRSCSNLDLPVWRLTVRVWYKYYFNHLVTLRSSKLYCEQSGALGRSYDRDIHTYIHTYNMNVCSPRWRNCLLNSHTQRVIEKGKECRRESCKRKSTSRSFAIIFCCVWRVFLLLFFSPVFPRTTATRAIRWTATNKP